MAREFPSIPVTVGEGTPAAALFVHAIALLHEIAAKLERLAESGESSTLDVRRLPMSTEEREALRSCLGTGEVEAKVSAMGPTTVRDTAVPGVWWVTHYNGQDAVIAELIEITEIPEILRSDPEDVRSALAGFRSRVAGMGDSKGASGFASAGAVLPK